MTLLQVCLWHCCKSFIILVVGLVILVSYDSVLGLVTLLHVIYDNITGVLWQLLVQCDIVTYTMWYCFRSCDNISIVLWHCCRSLVTLSWVLCDIAPMSSMVLLQGFCVTDIFVADVFLWQCFRSLVTLLQVSSDSVPHSVTLLEFCDIVSRFLLALFHVSWDIVASLLLWYCRSCDTVAGLSQLNQWCTV